MGVSVSVFGISAFVIICIIDLVLKKTLLKKKYTVSINEPWILEDFDEDDDQERNLPPEDIMPKRKLTDRLAFLKKRANKSDMQEKQKQIDFTDDKDNKGED